MQAEIADKLIRAGVPVVVFNQRSVAEIFGVLQQVAALVGCADLGATKLAEIRASMLRIEEQASQLKRRPKVYFEAWDDPQISAIRWVSELIGIAGGDDCFLHLSQQSLGKNRVISDPQAVIAANPDIIIGSWCGKKFRPEKVAARPGWSEITAVKTGQLHEIKSPEILQPGPAALTDGLRRLSEIVGRWAAVNSLDSQNAKDAKVSQKSQNMHVAG
jgi:iron complex transport system substrate-binding protein